jgi:hypothetical protein
VLTHEPLGRYYARPPARVPVETAARLEEMKRLRTRPPILHAETRRRSSSFGEEQITMVVVVVMMVVGGLTEEEGKNAGCRLSLPQSPAQGDISAEVFAIRRTPASSPPESVKPGLQ